LAATKNQWIRHGGVKGKIKFSLLTGKRMTTVTNTIACKIYLHIALGDLSKLILAAFYVGDDIVLSLANRDDARKVIKKAISSKSAFNKRKQSWGEGAEFLRHAILGNASYGYLNRTLASFVCGSWVNHLKLADFDIPGVYQRMCWTADNRAQTEGVMERLVSRSLEKRSGLDYWTSRHITGHRAVVNGGPCLPNANVVTILLPETEPIRQPISENAKAYATEDYLSQFKEKFESLVGNPVMQTLHTVFKEASYSKGTTTGYVSKYMRRIVRPIAGHHININFLKDKVKANTPITSKHPTLPSLKNSLSYKEMQILTSFLVGESYTGHIPVKEWLFGNECTPIACDLCHAYDDMAQLGNIDLLRGLKRVAVVVTNRICHY